MNRLHSLFALGALALALLLAPSAAAAQQQGTVYLNDGSVVTGQILEYQPGVQITVQIGEAAPTVIPQARIARVEIGQAPANPFPPPPPPAQPYYAQDPAQPQQYQQPQPYPQPQQYQLAPPGTQPVYAPRRRRPSLGLPITFLAVGAALALSGGALISLSNDGYYGGRNDLIYPGIGLATTGGVFLSLGIVFLIIRIGQRRRWSREQQAQPSYGLAPLVAPEQGQYGLQALVSF